MNCGLEFEIENNRIVRVRPDKDNPRSKGYCCRKGLNMPSYFHNADRISYPLKRVGDRHERITWEQALAEIAQKAAEIKNKYGPKAFAYMGGIGTGGSCEAASGATLNKLLGAGYVYTPLMQEYSNLYWVEGRLTGRPLFVAK